MPEPHQGTPHQVEDASTVHPKHHHPFPTIPIHPPLTTLPTTLYFPAPSSPTHISLAQQLLPSVLCFFGVSFSAPIEFYTRDLVIQSPALIVLRLVQVPSSVFQPPLPAPPSSASETVQQPPTLSASHYFRPNKLNHPIPLLSCLHPHPPDTRHAAAAQNTPYFAFPRLKSSFHIQPSSWL